MLPRAIIVVAWPCAHNTNHPSRMRPVRLNLGRGRPDVRAPLRCERKDSLLSTSEKPRSSAWLTQGLRENVFGLRRHCREIDAPPMRCPCTDASGRVAVVTQSIIRSLLRPPPRRRRLLQQASDVEPRRGEDIWSRAACRRGSIISTALLSARFQDHKPRHRTVRKIDTSLYLEETLSPLLSSLPKLTFAAPAQPIFRRLRFLHA